MKQQKKTQKKGHPIEIWGAWLFKCSHSREEHLAGKIPCPDCELVYMWPGKWTDEAEARAVAARVLRSPDFRDASYIVFGQGTEGYALWREDVEEV